MKNMKKNNPLSLPILCALLTSLFVVVLVGCVSVGTGVIVKLPDAHLQARLNHLLNQAGGTPLVQTSFVDYDQAIDLTGAQIVNFSGFSQLQWSKNVQILNLSHLPQAKWSTLSLNKDLANQIHILYLDHDQLHKLPHFVKKLPHLTEIFLSNNDLDPQKIKWSQWPNLLLVNLNNNQIQTFPTSMAVLNKLIWLYLSHNQIRTFPLTLSKKKVPLSGYPKLTNLYLSNNHLEGQFFTAWPYSWTIQTLFIDNNRIKNVNSSMEKKLKKLNILNIAHNPFTIDKKHWSSILFALDYVILDQKQGRLLYPILVKENVLFKLES